MPIPGSSLDPEGVVTRPRREEKKPEEQRPWRPEKEIDGEVPEAKFPPPQNPKDRKLHLEKEAE